MNRFSGNIIGAHQKIDRTARRHLERLLPKSTFPKAKYILHFEGHNGPDALKRKSMAKDEPRHFLQPFDETDIELIKLVKGHYKLLVKALKERDDVRAAFEAAWLSHAMVDGLTPAHHYPYEEKLVELASGRTIEERTTVGERLILPGDTPSDQMRNNWQMWGPKGLFTTHAAFEWGVAMLMAPQKLTKALPTADKIAEFQAQELGYWFRQRAQDIARLELYDAFYKTGWTVPLARQVRLQLAPQLVEAITLAWYGAAIDAGLPLKS